jgi:hypothetical protein
LDLACDLGQGYWFGRPMPAIDIDWTNVPIIRQSLWRGSKFLATGAVIIFRVESAATLAPTENSFWLYKHS